MRCDSAVLVRVRFTPNVCIYSVGERVVALWVSARRELLCVVVEVELVHVGAGRARAVGAQAIRLGARHAQSYKKARSQVPLSSVG